MGKFAGFLKRAKKIAGFGLGVLNKLNDVYKGVKPYVSDIIEMVPYGNYINKGLDIGSKILDKTKPLKNVLLDNEEDKKKSKRINKKVKQYVGKGTEYALNKFLDTQEGEGINLDGLFGNTIN